MEKSVRTRLLTAAVLVIVFGAGIVLGMALNRNSPRRWPRRQAGAESRTRRAQASSADVHAAESDGGAEATLDSLFSRTGKRCER